MKTRICRASGCQCTALEGKRYCAKHKDKENEKRTIFTYRGKSGAYNNLYHTAGWKKLRAQFLAKYPRCFICGKPATIADHIIAHKGDLALFYNEDNLQPMCWGCHSRKTFAENKNFNNRGGSR